MSHKGLQALMHDEGLRLKAYKDSAGIWTIGVGHTGKVDGVLIHEGMQITKSKALELLRQDVEIAENSINYHLKQPISQHQFDAFVNLAFNIGVTAFSKSTALREFNKGNVVKAAEAITWWVKAYDPKTKTKRTVEGLARRRARTKKMFERGEYITA